MDIDVEFDNIATSSATKYDSDDLATQAAAEAGTDNTTLMTPLRTAQAISVQTASAGVETLSKAMDEIVSNSTVLQTDDDLTGFTLNANTTYLIRGALAIDQNTTSDFKAELTFSASPVSTYTRFGAGGLAGANGDVQEGEASVVITASISDVLYINIDGFVSVGGAGITMDLEWAQNVAQVFNTTIFENSWISVIEVV